MASIQAFLNRHDSATFRNSDELFAAIASGSCSLETSPDGSLKHPTTAHLTAIYDRRRRHLEELQPRSPHVGTLLVDVVDLCDGLRRCSDRTIAFWSFKLSGGRTISVFEGAESNQIVGCFASYDRRDLSDAEWQQIWEGDATNPAAT